MKLFQHCIFTLNYILKKKTYYSFVLAIFTILQASLANVIKSLFFVRSIEMATVNKLKKKAALCLS